jgi:hypothetical protein
MSRKGRNLRFAATIIVVAAALSLLTTGSDGARASKTISASGRTFVYRGNPASLVGYVERCCARRWNVYQPGDQLAGMVRRADRYPRRWNIYENRIVDGSVRLGYVQQASRERWNVYASPGSQRWGYVKRRYGSRWAVYSWNKYTAQYSHEGYAEGRGGLVGGAAMLFLLPPLGLPPQ